MSTDIMCDLETLDTANTAVILSIGACVIDWKGETIGDKFYVAIKPESCDKVGLTRSASTEAWWAKQSEEARKVLSDPEAVDLEEALIRFAKWLKTVGQYKTTYVWGNGATFDNTILENAYKACNFNLPWPWYNHRCYRTVKDVCGLKDREPARVGTYHNALDDAIHQTRTLLLAKSQLMPR
jgi:hypothetical protein